MNGRSLGGHRDKNFYLSLGRGREEEGRQTKGLDEMRKREGEGGGGHFFLFAGGPEGSVARCKGQKQLDIFFMNSARQ